MTDAPRHPLLVPEIKEIALSSDKIREIEAASLRLHKHVVSGDISTADAMDGLLDTAIGHSLCSTTRDREDIEHVIRQGLAGRKSLSPATNQGQAAQQAEVWPIMADEAYHGIGGEFIKTILPHSEADPAALLVQFLAAVGNAIGRGPHYCVEGDLHFTKLNVLLVGATSAGRGTSLSRVLQVLEIADSNWSDNRVHSGLASGEGLIHHVRDAALRLKDGQWEEIDAGVCDKRLLVDAQEFASVLGVMAKPGNTLSPVIRDAWGHRVLQTLGKTSPEKATGAHISIIGHITEQELKKTITRTDLANGFANRFLFCKSRRSKKLPHGGSLRDVELDRLGQLTRDAIDRAKTIGRLTMTQDASAEWEALYNVLDDYVHGLVAEVTNRAAPYILRIAVIYAALDGSSQIDLVHLRAAVAVWQYCEESARQIFGGSTGDPLTDTIMSALKGAAAGLTRDEIGRLFSWNKSASEIGSALDCLEKQGLARKQLPASRGPGRPTERWFASDSRGAAHCYGKTG